MSPEINFDAIPDADSYEPLPDGDYVCYLDTIEEATTKNGNDMWKLTWVIEDGEHAGRKIFDNMVFSERAMRRIKLICSRLGLDTTGTVNLTPDMLAMKRAVVSVMTEEYVNAEGQTRQRNAVPFEGYERIGANDEADPGSDDDDDDIAPF